MRYRCAIELPTFLLKKGSHARKAYIYICIEICLLYECMDMHCRVATVLLAGTPPELPPGILRKNPPAQLKKCLRAHSQQTWSHHVRECQYGRKCVLCWVFACMESFSCNFFEVACILLKEIPLHVFLWGCCPQTLFRKISAMWPVASCQSRNVQPIQKLFILSQPMHIYVFWGSGRYT